jgi:hypothetical protein
MLERSASNLKVRAALLRFGALVRHPRFGL